MTEDLNPRLSAAIQALMAPKVEWRDAPPLAAAYIAARVDGETHGCWVLDTHNGQRTCAPSFGIDELLDGQTFVLRRPGSEYTPLVLDILHRMFAPHCNNGWSQRLLLISPETFDELGIDYEDGQTHHDKWVRPKSLKPDRLSFAIEVSLA